MFTKRQASPGRSGVAWTIVLAGLVVAPAAMAAPTLRVQVDQRGDFVLIGNTIGFECDAGVPAPLVGTVGACGTDTADSSPDVYWRADDPAPGMASANTGVLPANARSTAVLILPPGASVTHAFLYWAGSLGAAAVPDTKVTIERPGTFSQEVDATTTFPATLGGNQPMYQSVADVTALVQAHGAGAYRVAGIDAEPSFVDADLSTVFGGWSLVIFYERPGDPARNLALFDGCDVVNQDTQTVVLDGLRVPASGFDGKLGVIAYEGDGAVPGDELTWDGTVIGDAANPPDNFFNGSRTYFGAGVSNPGDLPRLDGSARSMAGLDLDVVDIAPLLVGGQESATIQASASGDTYALGAFVTSVSTLVPDFAAATKVALDVDGGSLLAGDRVAFTLVVTNGGSDASVDTRLVDDLPQGMTYVPGSLTVDGVARTDAVGDDVFDHDGATRRLTVRLGTGADATTGGTMAIGATATVRFLVTIDATATRMLQNQAHIFAEGSLGGAPDEWVTGSPDGPGTATVLVIDVCAPGECPTATSSSSGGGGGTGSVSSNGGASGSGGGSGGDEGLRPLGNGFTCAASGAGGEGGGGGDGQAVLVLALAAIARRRARKRAERATSA